LGVFVILTEATKPKRCSLCHAPVKGDDLCECLGTHLSCMEEFGTGCLACGAAVPGPVSQHSKLGTWWLGSGDYALAFPDSIAIGEHNVAMPPFGSVVSVPQSLPPIPMNLSLSDTLEQMEAKVEGVVSAQVKVVEDMHLRQLRRSMEKTRNVMHATRQLKQEVLDPSERRERRAREATRRMAISAVLAGGAVVLALVVAIARLFGL
jgi:hypothetical protein